MIGERMLMKMPMTTYLKLARAKAASIKMGKTIFEIASEQQAAMLEFARQITIGSD